MAPCWSWQRPERRWCCSRVGATARSARPSGAAAAARRSRTPSSGPEVSPRRRAGLSSAGRQ
eukprot:3300707-Alexandrium_andersonii.AAC.1